jgi:hypothetical protein
MKTLHYSLICVLLLTCCTIYEKTIVKITPPSTKNIKVLPFVEILGETNAVIIWQVKNVENSFLEFKEEGEEIKIIPAVSSNELFRADVQKLEPNTIYYYRIAGTKSEFSTLPIKFVPLINYCQQSSDMIKLTQSKQNTKKAAEWRNSPILLRITKRKVISGLHWQPENIIPIFWMMPANCINLS